MAEPGTITIKLADDVRCITDNVPTLRDMFAMHALAGLLAACKRTLTVANAAYEYADAMMEARKGGA
jgi:hypothetical protein